MKPDRVIAMLSMAEKAGKIASGSFMAEKSIKSRRAFLVVLATDASENTKKSFFNACAYRNIPCFEYADSQALGNGIGKGYRKVLAVCDEGLAKSIIGRIKEVVG
ncbi:MAG: ribosomal L7Ae/L30e/S12e/Gadd45 family protein [Lachnospiraceae bacterium]|nr:ribosomal L7Ae/L30e/S12e/Gadd45 family protein [Lachnospiraceae bacterium]